jgi:hypothetical protein
MYALRLGLRSVGKVREGKACPELPGNQVSTPPQCKRVTTEWCILFQPEPFHPYLLTSILRYILVEALVPHLARPSFVSMHRPIVASPAHHSRLSAVLPSSLSRGCLCPSASRRSSAWRRWIWLACSMIRCDAFESESSRRRW